MINNLLKKAKKNSPISWTILFAHVCIPCMSYIVFGSVYIARLTLDFLCLNCVAILGHIFAQTHDAYPGRKRQTREKDFGKFIKMFVSVLNKSIKFGLKDCT